MNNAKRYRNILTLVLGCALFAATSATAQNDATPDVLLQRAIQKEMVDGDLAAAIDLYKTVTSARGASRSVTASALLHLGRAYEKLGSAEARKAYERIGREFADQKDVAADAGRRLAALGGGTIASGDNLRRVAVPTNSYPTFSFDGRWVTSTRWGAPGRDKGYNELLVQDTTTGEAKRLAEGSCGSPCAFSEGAMISPDAKLVAYSWYDDAEIKGHGQLRVIANELGALPRVLVRKDEVNVDPIDWAPDSRSILVGVRKKAPDRSLQLGWVSVADGTLKIIKSIERRASGGAQVSLSPDGRHIAYAAFVTNSTNATASSTDPTDTRIYLLAADGSNEVALVKSAGVNKSPVWTPDGSHVVFTSNLSGKTDLWSVAVRNGKPEGTLTLLKRDLGEIEVVGMTKAGTFYFEQSKTGVEQIHVAELAPGGASRILESFVGFNPSWSPDGKALAFKRHSTRSQWNNVVVRSVEAGQEKTFSRDTRWDIPHWLHDSTRLLTLADPDHEGGDPWWHIVDLTKNTFNRVIPRGAFQAMEAAISSDEKTLYVVAREPSDKFNGLDRIVAVDLATGQEREVIRFSGTPETLPVAGGVGVAISPDSRTLAVATTHPKTAEARLFRVDVDGGNYRELHGPYRANSTWEKLVWTKDGRSILFAVSVGGRGSNRRSEIMRIASAGGTPESTGLTLDNLRTFDLSPDGTRIAYCTAATRLESTRGVFAIDNLPALLSGAKP